MRTIAKLVIFILLFYPFSISAQHHYNIDKGSLKKRRLDISYFFKQSKTSIQESKERRKQNKIENKKSKATKRHTYNNQTRVVRKRMKKIEKRAKHFNNGSVPLRIKFKRVFYG